MLFTACVLLANVPSVLFLRRLRHTLRSTRSFSLFDGVNFNSTITRARFEDLCMDYFKNCMDPCEKVLRDSKISKSAVDCFGWRFVSYSEGPTDTFRVFRRQGIVQENQPLRSRCLRCHCPSRDSSGSDKCCKRLSDHLLPWGYPLVARFGDCWRCDDHVHQA